MKKQYYYVITSLPYLSLNEKLPISKDDFLAICKKYLNKIDFSIIASVNLLDVEKDKVPLDIIRRFFSWERGVRNALVKLRAERLGLDSDDFIRGDISDHSTGHFTEEAFNADSPLMAEDILNKARWEYLDELEFGYYFDIEILVIFFIKLQILERISLFDAVKGQEKLNAFVTQGAPDTD
ncbi:MAG: DUF2764 family protein [Planctomycetota bacterium]|jgi:hypothetical protein